jgi:hypothetical protein
MWITAKTIAQLQTQGSLSYLSTTVYAKGALCYVTDGSTIGQYVSLENGNTGNDPLSSPSKWSPIAPIVSWNTRAANGACSIGDFQVRWGTSLLALAHNVEATATFTTPFSNACFVVMLTPVNTSTENGSVGLISKTTSTFRYTAVADSIYGMTYFAVGY